MSRKVMRENELKDARSFLIKMQRIVDTDSICTNDIETKMCHILKCRQT